MWKSPRYYLIQNKFYLIKNKEEGFTLVELLLSLAISFILFLSFYSILRFTNNTCKIGDEMDEVILNGQYAIEYIKRETKQAEEIISIDKIDGLGDKYPNNIGFVIMRYYPDLKQTEKYNFSTYYLKNNQIHRIALNKSSDKLPRYLDFSGYNIVAEYALDIKESNIDFKSNTIDLKFVFGGPLTEEIVFKTKIFIRCPILY